jgi:hypothetical protein
MMLHVFLSEVGLRKYINVRPTEGLLRTALFANILHDVLMFDCLMFRLNSHIAMRGLDFPFTLIFFHSCPRSMYICRPMYSCVPD